MHYEINVARNGKHLFGTHKRSLTTWEEAKTLLALFYEKFPRLEGYECGLTRVDEAHHPIDECEILPAEVVLANSVPKKYDGREKCASCGKLFRPGNSGDPVCSDCC